MSISISPTSASLTHGTDAPVEFEAEGATGPVQWAVIPGSVLPPGTSFSTDVGNTGARLVGAPSAVGSFVVSLSAVDNGQSPPQAATQQVTLTVT